VRGLKWGIGKTKVCPLKLKCGPFTKIGRAKLKGGKQGYRHTKHLHWGGKIRAQKEGGRCCHIHNDHERVVGVKGGDGSTELRVRGVVALNGGERD